jgi:hypothetical protein
MSIVAAEITGGAGYKEIVCNSKDGATSGPIIELNTIPLPSTVAFSRVCLRSLTMTSDVDYASETQIKLGITVSGFTYSFVFPDTPYTTNGFQDEFNTQLAVHNLGTCAINPNTGIFSLNLNVPGRLVITNGVYNLGLLQLWQVVGSPAYLPSHTTYQNTFIGTTPVNFQIPSQVLYFKVLAPTPPSYTCSLNTVFDELVLAKIGQTSITLAAIPVVWNGTTLYYENPTPEYFTLNYTTNNLTFFVLGGIAQPSQEFVFVPTCIEFTLGLLP